MVAAAWIKLAQVIIQCLAVVQYGNLSSSVIKGGKFLFHFSNIRLKLFKSVVKHEISLFITQLVRCLGPAINVTLVT